MSTIPPYAPIKVGDTAGLLPYQVTNGSIALPVSGATVVCRWVNRDTGAVVVDDQPGVIIDGPGGIVGYQRVAADVATAQPVIIQFTIVFTSGDPHVSLDIGMRILPAR